jgi:hypothetical protein
MDPSVRPKRPLGPRSRRWTVTVDWAGLARYALWLAWLVVSRIALVVSATACILAALGYTPSTAPDVHGAMAGVTVVLVNGAVARRSRI